MNNYYNQCFDPVTQLEQILIHWKPDSRIEIEGVLLDYVSRGGRSLVESLRLNSLLCNALFAEGNTNATALLLATTESDDDRRDILTQYGKEFPSLAHALGPLVSASANAGEDERGVREVEFILARTKSKTVIWQLSDIHFGKFNTVQNDPVELASMLGCVVGNHEVTRPDYVIVTGDLTSVAVEEEFSAFERFCRTLAEQVWGGIKPQRIIVVPGNHDTRWIDDGSADRLQRFSDLVANHGFCITPFGEQENVFADPNVRVVRYVEDAPDSPPIAVVTLEDAGIELVLLVSAYYSGVVPEDMRKLLAAEVGSSEARRDLIAHIRTDVGEMTMRYLSLIARSLEPAALPRLAVTHHHLEQFGHECNCNGLAYDLQRTLAEKGVSAVLHGHLHMFESRTTTRTVTSGSPFGIPCSTLSSYTTRRSPGFLIHVYNRNDDSHLATLEWELSDGHLFHWENLRVTYRLQMAGMPRIDRVESTEGNKDVPKGGAGVHHH